MKNFRKLSALILSALASFTLLVGCGAAPVSDDISGGASYEEDWGSAPAASQDASQSAGESDPDALLPEGGSVHVFGMDTFFWYFRQPPR